MYQAPDFVKVDVCVKDAFAAYGSVVCNEDEGYVSQWNYTNPCSGTAGYREEEIHTLYTQLTPASPWQCYSTQNAPGT